MKSSSNYKLVRIGGMNVLVFELKTNSKKQINSRYVMEGFRAKEIQLRTTDLKQNKSFLFVISNRSQ